MRLAVLGGTGRTGRLLVGKAVREHAVRVLARRPGEARQRFGHLGPLVEVVEGDLLDAESLHRLLQHHDGPVDAVVSAAGPVPGGGAEDMQQAARHLVSAMRGTGVTRCVWLTGAGVRSPQDQPGWVDRGVVGVMHVVARRTLRDSREAVRVLTDSGLDWTVIRAPRLTDGVVSPSPTVVPGVGRGAGMTAARATVAEVLLQVAADGSWPHASPVVSD